MKRRRVVTLMARHLTPGLVGYNRRHSTVVGERWHVARGTRGGTWHVARGTGTSTRSTQHVEHGAQST